MAWQAAASLGMSLVSGWLGRQQQKAANIVYDAEAAASNKVRAAKNVEAAAGAALANFMVAENNKRRTRAAGAQYTALQQTLQRQREEDVRSDLEQRISKAEGLGAYAANAAMSGAAGATVDVIDATIRLKEARRASYQSRAAAYRDYDTKQMVAGIIPQTIRGLDLTQVVAGIDYGTTTSRAQPAGNWMTDVLAWAMDNPAAGRQLAQSAGSFFRSAPTSKYALTPAPAYGLQAGGGLGLRQP